MQFQNGSNKVAIELSGVQFWSEIILVISNRAHATRSFDFEITRMISDQTALHSVQLPLLISNFLSSIDRPPRLSSSVKAQQLKSPPSANVSFA